MRATLQRDIPMDPIPVESLCLLVLFIEAVKVTCLVGLYGELMQEIRLEMRVQHISERVDSGRQMHSTWLYH